VRRDDTPPKLHPSKRQASANGRPPQGCPLGVHQNDVRTRFPRTTLARPDDRRRDRPLRSQPRATEDPASARGLGPRLGEPMLLLLFGPRLSRSSRVQESRASTHCCYARNGAVAPAKGCSNRSRVARATRLRSGRGCACTSRRSGRAITSTLTRPGEMRFAGRRWARRTDAEARHSLGKSRCW
jgi:hypothetical protein